MPALSAYDHIRENNRRIIFLLVLFPAALTALAFLAALAVLEVSEDSGAHVETAAGYAAALALPITIAATIWVAVSYLFGDRMMLGFAGSRKLTREGENLPVFRIAENAALAAGVPAPAIYVIDDDSLNAFAAGRSPEQASIALTSGIIAKLSKEELEGVVAHEIAHIKNRDMRLNQLVITGFGALAFFADIAWRLMRAQGRGSSRSNNKGSGGALAIIFSAWAALTIFNLIVAPLIHMALSRTQEYNADALGAAIMRNPKALASALRKIAADPVVEAMADKKAMAAACISYPHAKGASSLLSTHPPIELRIARLENM